MLNRPRPGSLLPMRSDADCPATCSTRQTIARLADRWTILLLEQLAGGARRFGQLRATIDGISEKMLTQTLRSLERDGIVTRVVLAQPSAGSGYQLTDLGRSLLVPLEAVRYWGEQHMPDVEQARAAYDNS